jgi:hypothetical protein
MEDSGAYDAFGSRAPQPYANGAAASGGGGGNWSSSSSSSAAAAAASSSHDAPKKRVPQALIPVNCKQIQEAIETSKGEFVLADSKLELTQVKCIANVTRYDQKPTYLELEVEDGTGRAVVRQYIDDSPNDLVRLPIREGHYRRIIGKLARIGTQVVINAFSNEPIIDQNEIAMHLSDIIVTHLRATRGNLSSSPGGAGAGASASASASAARNNQPTLRASTGNPYQDKVLAAFVAGATSEHGCPRVAVVQRLAGHMAPKQIDDAIEALCAAGHLYSTIDDQHL